ncbi:cupin domain-containing protein [Bacillus mycoides]|uniref:cupin domain-containing protein n=1 Tax=Bacillus mycoides TaxID=1405 RepID=UPI0022B595FB|nr:cupin domain-containing protein [Bacillus mycoides]MCZ6944548.1 cupin domain-containing protein [Bacillus mycoides]
MKTIMNLNEGKVFKVNDFQWEDVSGCKMAKPVSPELGSKNITGMIVDIPAGGDWTCCEIGINHEVVVVVFQGSGTAVVGEENTEVSRATTLYAPTGTGYSVQANKGEMIRLYIWQSLLPKGNRTSNNPKLVNNLFNNETIFKGFKGTDPTQVNNDPANMNFLFWPGTGCAHLSLHCGIQQPGQNFGVHTHPISEELFIGVEGKGQVHLNGEWIDFGEGDILYSPEKIFHGTRNPYTGPEAKRFVTCGGPVPYDINFYLMANVSPELK